MASHDPQGGQDERRITQRIPFTSLSLPPYVTVLLIHTVGSLTYVPA